MPNPSTQSTQPAVLIDVDGTLSDSLQGIQLSFLEALKTIDVTPPNQEFLDSIAGPPMVENLARLGLDDAQIQAASSTYYQLQRDGGWRDTKMFELDPSWPELLHSWREAGYTIATATSKSEYFTEKVLEDFGIRQYFNVIGAASNDGSRRTKDDVITHTLELLNHPSKAVMIGDRIHDFSGATNHGLPVIAVSWGYGSDNERRKATATAHTGAELATLVAEQLER